jgi:hypothetical protein
MAIKLQKLRKHVKSGSGVYMAEHKDRYVCVLVDTLNGKERRIKFLSFSLFIIC